MIYFSINEYVISSNLMVKYNSAGILEQQDWLNLMTFIKVNAFVYIIIIVISLLMYWLYKTNKNRILLFISGVMLLLTIPDLFYFDIYNFEIYIYTLLGIIGLIYSIKGLKKQN